MRCAIHGVDAELAAIARVRDCPTLSSTSIWTRAFRSRAGLLQPAAARCGMTRWPGDLPAARAMRGVDVIQNCEVTGISIGRTAASVGVETTRGRIGAKACHRRGGQQLARSADMAGLRLPIEIAMLQALVSEGLKPTVHRRDHVRGRSFLHQPVRQGRAGVRRRYRRLQQLRAARQSAHARRCVAKRGMALMPAELARCAHAAQLGRGDGHVDGRLADHRPDADRRASI